MTKLIGKTFMALVILSSFFQLLLLSQGLRTIILGSKEASESVFSEKGNLKKIVMEKINLDLDVVSVPLINGTWQVNEGVANFAQGTSFVNPRKGNVGLYAHDKPNGFQLIKKLAEGDLITLYGQGYRAVYEVNKTSVITPDMVDVFYPTDRAQITLVTCDGTFSEKRYMVVAVLKEFIEI